MRASGGRCNATRTHVRVRVRDSAVAAALILLMVSARILLLLLLGTVQPGRRLVGSLRRPCRGLSPPRPAINSLHRAVARTHA